MCSYYMHRKPGLHMAMDPDDSQSLPPPAGDGEMHKTEAQRLAGRDSCFRLQHSSAREICDMSDLSGLTASLEVNTASAPLPVPVQLSLLSRPPLPSGSIDNHVQYAAKAAYHLKLGPPTHPHLHALCSWGKRLLHGLAVLRGVMTCDAWYIVPGAPMLQQLPMADARRQHYNM